MRQAAATIEAVKSATTASTSYHGRHSGAMPTGPRGARPDDRLRIEPGISRFRVRVFDAPGMTTQGSRRVLQPFQRFQNLFLARHRGLALFFFLLDDLIRRVGDEL